LTPRGSSAAPIRSTPVAASPPDGLRGGRCDCVDGAAARVTADAVLPAPDRPSRPPAPFRQAAPRSPVAPGRRRVEVGLSFPGGDGGGLRHDRGCFVTYWISVFRPDSRRLCARAGGCRDRHRGTPRRHNGRSLTGLVRAQPHCGPGSFGDLGASAPDHGLDLPGSHGRLVAIARCLRGLVRRIDGERMARLRLTSTRTRHLSAGKLVQTDRPASGRPVLASLSWSELAARRQAAP
jgi:hypothetical protein